jgi:hypothetical protein
MVTPFAACHCLTMRTNLNVWLFLQANFEQLPCVCTASFFRAGFGSGSKFVAADRVPSPNGTLHSLRIYHKISAEEISEPMKARSNMSGIHASSAFAC